MVKVKCNECGEKYELDKGKIPSNYVCECGGDLDYEDELIWDSKISKKPAKSKKPVKTIVIVSAIFLLVLIFVLLTVFSNVFAMGNQTIATNNSTSNNTTDIAYSTYAAKGITFNYPSDWVQITNLGVPGRWGFTNPVVAFFDPEGNKTEADELNTYFYIKQRHVRSLEQMLSTYRVAIADMGQIRVSERNITVNGMGAVELIKTWNNGDKQFRALTVHIEVIPGSLYYRIGCVTPEDQYNSALPIFEKVVYSFNVL